MKFYQRHPFLFIAELVFLIVYYLVPIIYIVAVESTNSFFEVMFMVALFWTEIIFNSSYMFLIIPHLFVLIGLLLPILIILVVNAIVSLFEPMEKI